MKSHKRLSIYAMVTFGVAAIIGSTVWAATAETLPQSLQEKNQRLQQIAQKVQQKNQTPANPTIQGFKPVKLYPEPDWAKKVAQMDITALPGWRELQVKTLWQDGSVSNTGYTIWTPFLVWGGQNVIGTFAGGAPDFMKYRVQYTAPKQVGSISITGIHGDIVQFTTSTGTTGSFNLQTHTWLFP